MKIESLLETYTKKDFEMVANGIHTTKVKYKESENALGWLAMYFASHFKASNPNFDEERFLKAAGFDHYNKKHHDKEEK